MILRRLSVRSNCSAWIFPLNRWASAKTTAAKKESSTKNKKYSATVNLPKTDFPIHVADGKARLELDQFLLAKSSVATLYKWQRENLRDEKDFILHDGPPYANGDVHVGHAVNKILKDITNRFKLLSGFRVDYRPGWDCHGLPIELKALEQLGSSSQSTVSPAAVREAAKTIVRECSTKQKNAFASWGVMADFSPNSPNIYMTTSPAYEAKQIELFGRLFEKGLIYRELKPVYWSPSSQTSLAEAELEYNPTHQSTATYVAFPVNERGDKVHQLLPPQFSQLDWFAAIWTTTPWSLPGNDAIAYNPDMRYTLAVAQRNGSLAVYIVGENELPKIRAEMDLELITDNISFSGRELQDFTYSHPLNPNRQCPFLAADHVALGKGTGLVHTAPAHGHDDYRVGLKHKLGSSTCFVDTQGQFTKEAGESLAGKDVLSDGTEAVIELLKSSGLLLGRKNFTHSYPYDWRSKKPVILRASEQWFIDVDKIRQPALDALEKVAMIPKSGKAIMAAQLKSRPYWCISRQRIWGVPIPVFYSAVDGKPLINQSSIEHVEQLIKSRGADIWWTATDDVLFPEAVRKSFGLTPDDAVTKGSDILDIWFESGTSWAAVLGEDKVADLYIEGNDQCGAWFQTSLLTSVALRDKAPFKKVFVHGFALDEKGEKMSKSLGNVVHPVSVTQKYGVDVLRWWVAQGANGSSNFLIGPNILEEIKKSLTKLRHTLRFLLGSLDHPVPKMTPAEVEESMPYIDKYMFDLCLNFVRDVRRHYEDMEYHKVTQKILGFTQGDDVSFYLSAVKDRLYCDPKDSPRRVSAQITLSLILCSILAVVEPITPLLAQEVYRHFVHATPDLDFDATRMTLMKAEDGTYPVLSTNTVFSKTSSEISMIQGVFMAILAVRSQLNQACVGSNMAQMRLHLQPEKDLFYDVLKSLDKGYYAGHGCSELHDIFGVAQVVLEPWTESEPDWLDGKRLVTLRLPFGVGQDLVYRYSIGPALGTQCGRCRKFNVTVEDDDLCARCHDAVRRVKNV